jgi:hypothetical protein
VEKSAQYVILTGVLAIAVVLGTAAMGDWVFDTWQGFFDVLTEMSCDGSVADSPECASAR